MILFRPVGVRELHLIVGSGFRAFPPRLPDKEIFYPVLDRSYAAQIARDWNTKDEASGYAGFVTQFELADPFANSYPVRIVGASNHRELWVPARDMLGLNLSIIGLIEVIEAYAGLKFKGTIDPASKLPITTFSANDPLLIVYRLIEDQDKIASIQSATLTTEEFGIESTHGLFGSAEWWDHVDRRDLEIHTLRGVITRVYRASMNDWPTFELRAIDGELSQWTREASSAGLADAYAPGRRVEIDYVIQRHRPKSFDQG